MYSVPVNYLQVRIQVTPLTPSLEDRLVHWRISGAPLSYRLIGRVKSEIVLQSAGLASCY